MIPRGAPVRYTERRDSPMPASQIRVGLLRHGDLPLPDSMVRLPRDCFSATRFPGPGEQPEALGRLQVYEKSLLLRANEQQHGRAARSLHSTFRRAIAPRRLQPGPPAPPPFPLTLPNKESHLSTHRARSAQPPSPTETTARITT